ncbi:MAG: alpha/beta hydrolase [Parvularcula sp.]|jgi:pimeloyl-ACP methyl ester carboxylesterase|nr:alpha/beta hydrolase [Parvularcula sp.]
MLSRLLFAGLAGLLVSCSSAPSESAVPPIHMEVTGSGEPTVVLIHGNGASSAAWEPVAPAIGDLGVRLVNLDRPGLGQSPLGPRPYRIDDEADALEAGLAAQKVSGPVILVAHSYGGLLAFLLADDIEDLRGIVLVDAVIPGEITAEQIEETFSVYRPQYEAVREKSPALAEAVIPVVEAMPETAERTEGITLPAGTPVITIKAPEGYDLSEEMNAKILAWHRQFVAQDPAHRKLIIAEGSGHQVMADRPDVVIEAVETLVETTRDPARP